MFSDRDVIRVTQNYAVNSLRDESAFVQFLDQVNSLLLRIILDLLGLGIFTNVVKHAIYGFFQLLTEKLGIGAAKKIVYELAGEAFPEATPPTST